VLAASGSGSEGDGGMDDEYKKNWSGVKGTPDYLAPEVVMGIGHGQTVDWWALGCVLYEFLIGFPPFCGSSVDEIFQRILARDIDWPPEEAGISDSAKDLIDKLVNFDPDQRLGVDGAKRVKEHPFFSDIDWEELLSRKQKALFTPRLKGAEDISYFKGKIAEEFPGEKVVSAPNSNKLGSAELGVNADIVNDNKGEDWEKTNYSFEDTSEPLEGNNYKVNVHHLKKSAVNENTKKEKKNRDNKKVKRGETMLVSKSTKKKGKKKKIRRSKTPVLGGDSPSPEIDRRETNNGKGNLRRKNSRHLRQSSEGDEKGIEDRDKITTGGNEDPFQQFDTVVTKNLVDSNQFQLLKRRNSKLGL